MYYSVECDYFYGICFNDVYDIYDVTILKMAPKKRKSDRAGKATKHVEDHVVISEDSMSPTRKSQKISKKKESQMITPKKLPVEIITPRMSRRSKDLSPPPLRHRQNRMPEQVALIRGDSKLFL